MVSVIIPNYNNLDYISICLDSVLNQSYNQVEIIVVDDCSVDGSREILKNYEGKYENLVVLYNERNLGVAKTREKGINAATKPYITTLDGDDYYYCSTKLEKEIELIIEYKNEFNEQIMPFSNVVFVDNQGHFIRRDVSTTNLKEGMIFEQILLQKCAIPRDFIFLKEHYFRTKGYDPSIPIYEDWDMQLQLSQLGSFVYTNNDGVAYRQTKKGLSSVSMLKHIKWRNHVFKKNVSSLKGWRKMIISSIMFKLILLRDFLGGMKNIVLNGSSGW